MLKQYKKIKMKLSSTNEAKTKGPTVGHLWLLVRNDLTTFIMNVNCFKSDQIIILFLLFLTSLLGYCFSLCSIAIRSVCCCHCCRLTSPVWWKLRSSRDWRAQTLARLRTPTIFTTSMSRDTQMSGMCFFLNLIHASMWHCTCETHLWCILFMCHIQRFT